MSDWGDALYQASMITVAAIFGIAVAKLLMARFPVPGLKDVVALV